MIRFRALLLRRQLQPLHFRQGLAVFKSSLHADVLTDGERKVAQALASKIDATWIKVRDISGGCGAMFEISVESEAFKGKRTVQQHRLVNQALSSEVKAMHGLRINTNIPGEQRKESTS